MVELLVTSGAAHLSTDSAGGEGQSPCLLTWWGLQLICKTLGGKQGFVLLRPSFPQGKLTPVDTWGPLGDTHLRGGGFPAPEESLREWRCPPHTLRGGAGSHPESPSKRSRRRRQHQKKWAPGICPFVGLLGLVEQVDTCGQMAPPGGDTLRGGGGQWFGGSCRAESSFSGLSLPRSFLRSGQR